MLRPNHLKQRIAAGRLSVGCWLFMASASNAELLSHAGFDALVVDMEHSPGGLSSAVDQMRAIGTRPDGPTILVRLPDATAPSVKPVLDSGAEGLLLPNAQSVDEAAMLVREASYPPRGVRGLHYTVSRAAHWGADTAAYPHHADSEILLVAMIESAVAVSRIPEMARTGVDMLLIGPLDLSASIGVPGAWTDPGFLDLWHEAERRTLEAGIALGGTILPDHSAPRLFDRGYSFVTVGADAGFLRGAALAALQSAGTR